MLGTYLPCLSLHSDHYFLPVASPCQTPALSIWELGSAPVPVLLNHRKISSTFTKLPQGCESEEMLEFGMGITWSLDCLEGFIPMRHEGLGYEVHDHTQVHKGTSRKPMGHGRETAGRTLTIPFFFSVFFFLFFFLPMRYMWLHLWTTQQLGFHLTNISHAAFHLYYISFVCVCVCGGLSIFFLLHNGEMKRSL